MLGLNEVFVQYITPENSVYIKTTFWLFLNNNKSRKNQFISGGHINSNFKSGIDNNR